MIDMGRDAACRQYLINALLKRSLSFQNIVKVSKQKGLTVTYGFSSLYHVGNNTVCDDQQHEVLRAICHLGRAPGDLQS